MSVRAFAVLLGTVVGAAVPQTVEATSGGQLGGTLRGLAGTDSGAGCASCHGNNPNLALGVVLSGPPALLPGATGVYSLTLSNVSNAAARIGFTAAVEVKTPQPSFSAGDGESQATGAPNSSQITHNYANGQAKPVVAGSGSYAFKLNMPANAVLGTTYTMYAVGNAGHGQYGRLVGWKHAENLVVKVAPPTPTTLTANQAGATLTTIPLSWSGTQNEHFRVIGKAGAFPSGPTDNTAFLVHEGNMTSGTAMGLSAGTRYFFAAYGKAPADAVYSDDAVQTTAATLPSNPTMLTATTASSTEINLIWAGTSAEFIVRGKAGEFPSSPTDATSKLVFQGAGTSKLDDSLNPGTEYFYRVWGKVAGTNVFSAAPVGNSASTDAQPMERFVDAVSGSDQGGANTCLAMATPCRTITRAMAAAGAGDIIRVGPGTYNVALGEAFPITVKNGVQLLASGTPFNTFIDGAGDPVKLRLLSISGHTSTATRIEGFTLRNGLNVDDADFGGIALGGALSVQSNQAASKVTVTRNVFANNEARGSSADADAGTFVQFAWGGAIYVFGSNVDIVNNVFSGNIARGGNQLVHPATPLAGGEEGQVGEGGAINFGGSGRIAHNTFVGNRAIGGNGGVGSDGVGGAGAGRSGAVRAFGDGLSIDSNVFVDNAALPGVGATEGFDPSETGALAASGTVAIRNNLFFANTENGTDSVSDSFGDDALMADPVFHAEPTNLRLRNSSPARGAGRVAEAPAADLDGAARPSPPAIGAFEGSLVTQAIVFGTAPTVSVGGTGQVNATGGGSGNPVTFGSQTPGFCTVAGSTVTGTNVGTCTVAANQAGTVDFSAAPQVIQSFAILAAPTRTLSVNRTGTGTGLVTSSPAGLDCGATCMANFVQGASVTLSADADAGSAFVGWSGGGCAGADDCEVTLNADTVVTAEFVALTTFAVSISGAQEVPPNASQAFGAGTAVINPASNALSYQFAVTGLPQDLSGAHFHGPAARGVNASVKINIGGNPFAGTVTYQQADEADLLGGLWYVNYHTVAFSGGEVRGQLDNLGGLFALSVARMGAGTGAVQSSPAGIDCGTACLAPFMQGAMVMLNAVPAPGSVFAGWSGDCGGGAPGCEVGMDQARNATARFEIATDLPEEIFANGFEAPP